MMHEKPNALNSSAEYSNAPSAAELPELPRRIRIAGLAIDPVTREQLFDWVVAAALQGRKDRLQRTVGYLNVHVANLAAKNGQLRSYLNSLCNLVYSDGNGIGLGARLKGLDPPPRMTAADWLPELLTTFRDATPGGLRVFIVAGEPGVADTALRNIAERTGQLGPIQTHDGYLNDAKSEAVIEQINAFKADIVLVGMGSPMQEQWTLKNRLEIDAPVVWPLGATFDYFTDQQERGSLFLRNMGHEWAARLLADPGRLWKRYLIGNPRFLLRVLWTSDDKE